MYVYIYIYVYHLSLSVSFPLRLPSASFVCVHRLCRDRAVKWRENTSRSGEVERAGNGRGDKESQPPAYRRVIFIFHRERTIRDTR